MEVRSIISNLSLTEFIIGQASAVNVNGNKLTYTTSKKQLCATFNPAFRAVQWSDYGGFRINVNNVNWFSIFISSHENGSHVDASNTIVTAIEHEMFYVIEIDRILERSLGGIDHEVS